jgi:hypothetical protein
LAFTVIPLILFFSSGIFGLMADELKYWFNQKTRQVETGPKSLAVNRLGPFDTFEEASRAEQVIFERARKLREEDSKEWDED